MVSRAKLRKRAACSARRYHSTPDAGDTGQFGARRSWRGQDLDSEKQHDSRSVNPVYLLAEHGRSGEETRRDEEYESGIELQRHASVMEGRPWRAGC